MALVTLSARRLQPAALSGASLPHVPHSDRACGAAARRTRVHVGRAVAARHLAALRTLPPYFRADRRESWSRVGAVAQRRGVRSGRPQLPAGRWSWVGCWDERRGQQEASRDRRCRRRCRCVRRRLRCGHAHADDRCREAEKEARKHWCCFQEIHSGDGVLTRTRCADARASQRPEGVGMTVSSSAVHVGAGL